MVNRVQLQRVHIKNLSLQANVNATDNILHHAIQTCKVAVRINKFHVRVERARWSPYIASYQSDFSDSASLNYFELQWVHIINVPLHKQLFTLHVIVMHPYVLSCVTSSRERNRFVDGRMQI